MDLRYSVRKVMVVWPQEGFIRFRVHAPTCSSVYGFIGFKASGVQALYGLGAMEC